MSLVPSGRKGATAKVDNTARQTWDKDEFRKRAEEKEKAADAAAGNKEDKFDIRRQKRLERDPLKMGLIVERSELKQRWGTPQKTHLNGIAGARAVACMCMHSHHRHEGILSSFPEC